MQNNSNSQPEQPCNELREINKTKPPCGLGPWDHSCIPKSTTMVEASPPADKTKPPCGLGPWDTSCIPKRTTMAEASPPAETPFHGKLPLSFQNRFLLYENNFLRNMNNLLSEIEANPYKNNEF